ncbi:MAG: response regulator, partial [Deltaproteobacteria bacterium]|nr:response regulator [Deltaproteobacteria bacterium]
MAARRILIVDDYPDIADTLCLLLEAMGHRCRFETEPSIALDVAITFAPEIALLDLNMPSPDGFEVARRLRFMAGRRPLFLAAMTGSGHPESQAKAVAAGFDHFALK